MKLELEPDPSLPRLAWCARLRRGSDTVRVRHGLWVETAEDCFFEGAWDGAFESRRFDQAATLAGSGARLVEGAIVFAAPSHMLERIHTIEVGEELYVSNSLVFLLTQAGDEPDLDHPDYFFDLLHFFRVGIRTTEKSIPTRNRNRVRFHDCCNLVVETDLTIRRIEKIPTEAPVDYAGHAGFLEETVTRVIRNAGDRARKRRYRPVATISRGYDSAAVSVLARSGGCNEAVTFRSGLDGRRDVDDDGTAVAACLGIRTTEYDRQAFEDLPGLPDAEFYLDPFATDRAMSVMADQLEGSVLTTGWRGDLVWGTDARIAWPLLQKPDSVLLSGAALVEFRLRTGFLHFPVAYLGALHVDAIHRISVSPEMRPWSVGGRYDRPIPRRILEEAGVPRHLFGRRKHGGHGWLGDRVLSPAGERDFLDFYSTRVSRNGHGTPREERRERSRWQATRAVHLLARPLRRTVLHRLASSLAGDRLHPLWRSRYRYAFHWGFLRTRERYALPPAARRGRPVVGVGRALGGEEDAALKDRLRPPGR